MTVHRKPHPNPKNNQTLVLIYRLLLPQHELYFHPQVDESLMLTWSSAPYATLHGKTHMNSYPSVYPPGAWWS